MNCIRCGKEVPGEQVFCDECLKDMEKHPVKPGTPIHLPERDNRVPTKRKTFRVAESKWKDQIFRLKYTIFWLILVIVLLTLALALCIGVMLDVLPQWLHDLLGVDALKESVIGLVQ